MTYSLYAKESCSAWGRDSFAAGSVLYRLYTPNTTMIRCRAFEGEFRAKIAPLALGTASYPAQSI